MIPFLSRGYSRTTPRYEVVAFTVSGKYINTMYQIDGKCTQTHQIDKLYKLKNTSKSFKKSENLYNLKICRRGCNENGSKPSRELISVCVLTTVESRA